MSSITKPLMLDETGKAIVEALTQQDMTQQRISEINTAAGTAKQEIENKKTDSVSAVENKTTECINAITQKGAETLESIPEDYTTLSSDVGSLKGDIGNIKEANREKWLSKIEILPNKDIVYNKLTDAEGTTVVLFPYSLGGVVYDFTEVCETLKRRLHVADDYTNRQNGNVTDRISVCDNNGTVEIAGTVYTKCAFIFDTILSVEEIKARVKIYALGLVEDKIKSNLYEKPEVQEQTENLITGKECILSGVKCSSSGKFVFSYDDSYTTVFCPVKAGDTVTSNCKITIGTMFTIESNFKLSIPTVGIGESATGAKYRSATIKHDGYFIISFEKNKFALTNSTSTDIDDLWVATKNLDKLYKNGGSKKRVTNDALQGLYDSAYILPEHTTNYYRGKKIAYIGDSTGAPNTSGGCGEYRKYVNKALGLEEAAWSSPVDIGYNNFSQGGSRMECESDANQYDSDGVAKESNGRYSACGDARVNALPQDCDIICIFMGVNASDHAMEKDTDTSLWSLENSDVTTFIGAYNVCISKIMYHYGMPAYYDNIDYSNVNVVGDGTNVPQIIVMTPVHSGDTLSDKMDSYQDRLNGHIIWRRKALEYMTGLWGTPYLDTQRCMMANPFTVPLYYRYVNDTEGYDKIHFNLRGAKQVADGLIGLLRSVEPISENVTIV